MSLIDVHLKENSYHIVVGENILSDLGKTLHSLNIGRDAVVITNPGIQKLHEQPLVDGLHAAGFTVKFFAVPPGERSKSAQAAFKLLQHIAHYDVKKKILIIIFGGGVVGDLAGFVAAVYRRGVPYVQVPTTLLAQIDSAIGGKVAIDLPVGKNLVGAFYQPKLVFSDVSVLSTLDVRQIRNGLAEAIKYGMICDENFFEFIEKNSSRLLHFDSPLFKEVVLSCSKIKAKIVMRDEKETKGIRTILNFGHTVGHAIEAAAGYNFYHHGEAITLGMRVAAEISYRLDLLNQNNVLRLNSVLSKLGLPERIKKVNLAHILQCMEHDKKFRAGKNKFVLATKVGSVKVVEDVPFKIIQASIKTFLS